MIQGVILMHHHDFRWFSSCLYAVSLLWSFIRQSLSFWAGGPTLRTPSAGSFMCLSSSALLVDPILFSSRAFSGSSRAAKRTGRESWFRDSRNMKWTLVPLVFFCFFHRWVPQDIRVWQQGNSNQGTLVLSYNGGRPSDSCTELGYLLGID